MKDAFENILDVLYTGYSIFVIVLVLGMCLAVVGVAAAIVFAVAKGLLMLLGVV